MSASISSSLDLARGLPRTGELHGGRTAALVHEPVVVEEIVHDLVEEAELGGEPPPRPLQFGRHLGDPEAAADRGLEEPRRLEPVQLEAVFPAAVDVEVLPGDHSRGGECELARDVRRLVANGKGERLVEERVAGEDRLPLAEANVHRRPAAALLVVVQRREVVVDERERVDQLQRGGCGERLVGIAAGGLRRRQAEHRPDALAAALERVADDLVQPAELR